MDSIWGFIRGNNLLSEVLGGGRGGGEIDRFLQIRRISLEMNRVGFLYNDIFMSYSDQLLKKMLAVIFVELKSKEQFDIDLYDTFVIEFRSNDTSR